MALAFKQGTTGNTNNGTTPTTAFASAVVAGNLLVVAVVDDSATTTSQTTPTDNKGGNTYTRVGTITTSTTSLGVYYCVVVNGGTGFVITVTWNTGNTGRCTICAQEFQGWTSTPTLDKTAGPATGSSTAPNSGATATTGSADQVVVGIMAKGGTTSVMSAGSGYTNLSTVNVANAGSSMESKIQASAAAQTAAFTIAASRAWQCIVLTFSDGPTGGGGGGFNNGMAMMMHEGF